MDHHKYTIPRAERGRFDATFGLILRICFLGRLHSSLQYKTCCPRHHQGQASTLEHLSEFRLSASRDTALLWDVMSEQFDNASPVHRFKAFLSSQAVPLGRMKFIFPCSLVCPGVPRARSPKPWFPPSRAGPIRARVQGAPAPPSPKSTSTYLYTHTLKLRRTVLRTILMMNAPHTHTSRQAAARSVR